MEATTIAQHCKFNFLQNVVNNLRHSQGFYSRLASRLEELTDDEISNIEAQLPDFKDKIDVVLYLEQ